MAAGAYPLWDYFPRNVRRPVWVGPVVALVGDAESRISTVARRTGLRSDDVLKELAPGLKSLGYRVEVSKRKVDRIVRPALVDRNGHPEVSFEVDAFHDEIGIVVEVEAGRAASNNAVFRDIIRASLILDAQYLILILPSAYRFNNGVRTDRVPVYDRGLELLSAIFASQRLSLPLDGILLLGY